MNMPDTIQRNVPLAPLTTLGVGGCADYFVSVSTIAALAEAVRFAHHESLPIRVLAGGSNMLVSDAGVRGLVIHMACTGMTYEEADGAHVRAIVGAGVVLDAFVEDAIARGLWGVENLSAIPGSVGATPVQNVGAYGVEVSDVIVEVRAFDTRTEKEVTLPHDACMFGYRDSIFKKPEGAHYIITAVVFALSKNPTPNIEYKDLKQRFGEGATPTLTEIRTAVQMIRGTKFPDWRVIGTAGSFFKNPIITLDAATQLLQKYPEIPTYNAEGGLVKVSLGYILDVVCGLKGYTENGVGLHEAQALVLVCAKGSAATAVEAFAQKISDIVFEKTAIRIEREVTMM